MSLGIVVRPGCKEVSQRKLEVYDKYSQIITWGRRNPVQFASRFMGVEALDLQSYVIANTWPADFALWLESRNAGKALALDTKIPTPDGMKTISDIRVGDYVFNECGTPVLVEYASPIFIGNPCYRVKFEDGDTIIADADHLWEVTSDSLKLASSYRPKTLRVQQHDLVDEDGFSVLRTKDLSRDFVKTRKDGKGNAFKYRVKNNGPIQYSLKNLPIHPYVFGLWLGDGTSKSSHISSHKNDVHEIDQYINECGYRTRITYPSDNFNPPYITIDPQRGKLPNPFINTLKKLNVYGNKHIPDMYMQADISQRIELLRGLMDTDGSCDNRGLCTFSQKSNLMIRQVEQLLSSLSIKNRTRHRYTKRDGKRYDWYEISFSVSQGLNCFKLSRKANRVLEKLASRSHYKSIVDIQEVPSVATKCIKVASENGLFLCGEKFTVTHNTTKLAIYTMLKSLLIPLHATYFLGNTGSQAKETFSKIEKLAKKEIESFAGCTDFFSDEIVRNGPTGDGFVHSPDSFTFKLFNGSTVNTLNSDITNIKGRRANLVCFDEAGWFSDELFVQAEQFVNQDENFKLGGNINVALEPRGFPRQLLYASSASDTDSEFYKKFRLFSERMLIGDTKYFACNIDIDMVMKAKFRGEEYPPLISKDKVEKAISDNKEKALRELYNKFSADSHEGQILTRRDLMQCTGNRPPLLSNDTGNRLFLLAWDSARLNDNSVIGAAELRMDPDKGWCMDLHNVISLVDVATKKKTPMRLPEQVKHFQNILLAYNGSEHMKLDYENIKAIVCDSGSGGQMIGGVSDYMLDTWIGSDGCMHKGIIDKTHKANETAKQAYPDAVDIMRLVDPRAHRNEIFDAAEKMIKLGVVSFPADYDGKDEIVNITDDGIEERYILSADEKMALIQLDLMKTEIVTMCKYSNGGNVTYNFPPDKRNTAHDDRAFVLGLLCWYLAQLRRGQLLQKPKVKNPDTLFTFKAPVIKRR